MSATSYLAVIRRRGPSWDDARPMRGQDEWDEHAAYMNALAEDGFVLLGGPLDDGQILLIVDSDEALRRRLAAD